MTTGTINSEEDTSSRSSLTSAVRTPKLRRKRLGWFGLASVGIMVAIGFGFLAPGLQPSLLAHAERISLPQIHYVLNACWLDNNQVVLYGRRGLKSSPLAVLDTRRQSVNFAVSQATQNACQPMLNAQSDAMASGSFYGLVYVNVWHDGSKLRRALPADYSFAVPPPAGAENQSPVAAALSPHRDRVVMMFEERGVSKFDMWIQRAFPSYHAVNSIYVCKVDGSEMRCLGSVPMYPVHLSGSSVIGNPIQHLSWTPDSRHVSFLYNNALWTIPTD